MMKKMKLHSPNLTQENIERIRELFPGCVTEAQGENDQLKLAVDFDQLRQELSGSIVEGPRERYHLNWPGKRDALLAANTPIAKTLRPCREESVDFDTTKNLFIEGDNLEALKLLQETYLGKVKMIYIDPPYNTGNDFIYKDDFAASTAEYLLDSGQKDEEGKRLVANTEANGRFHSDWLSMMYSRLRLARNVLSDDGVIFISIDDGEQSNLKKLCDEVFGSRNFISTFIWKSRQIIDSRNKTNASTDHEYILIYSKSIDEFSLQGKEIDTAKYSNPDNDPRGLWMSNSILGLANASQRPNLHYPITDPNTGWEFMCPSDSGWRYSFDTMNKKISDRRIVFPKELSGRPREKKYLSEIKSKFTGCSSVLSDDVGYTLNGTREVRDMMGGKLFDFPKPILLLKTLIVQGVVQNEDVVLDFFAGSATTAHAVMKLNAEDGGNRKFIMVQLPETCDEKSEAFKSGYKDIAAIAKERIRRAGAKILAGECHEGWNKDVGFRVLKVDSSSMKNAYYTPDAIHQSQLEMLIDNIKPGRTPEDLLFQVLLDWGVDLSLPIRKQSIQGKTVFFVDENALVACFDRGVNEDLVKELARLKPLRVVFRDNGFGSDSVKINVGQLFRQMSPTTELKSI